MQINQPPNLSDREDEFIYVPPKGFASFIFLLKRRITMAWIALTGRYCILISSNYDPSTTHLGGCGASRMIVSDAINNPECLDYFLVDFGQQYHNALQAEVNLRAISSLTMIKRLTQEDALREGYKYFVVDGEEEDVLSLYAVVHNNQEYYEKKKCWLIDNSRDQVRTNIQVIF